MSKSESKPQGTLLWRISKKFSFAAEKIIPESFVFCAQWLHEFALPLWKSVWRFLRKLGVNLPQDPAIPLLGIYPRDAKS